MFITGLVVWHPAGRLPLPLDVAGHDGPTVIVGLNGLWLLRVGPGGTGDRAPSVGIVTLRRLFDHCR